MAWVRFNRPFRWTPPERPRVQLRYRGDRAYNVPTACWRAARDAGAATRIRTPRRGEDPNAVRADGGEGAKGEAGDAGRR